MISTNGSETPRADVELRVPADSAYVSVLRSTAAGIASRLDFTLEGIEDLRIAVGEACALVLPEAGVGSTLTGEFFLSPERLTVTVAVTGADIVAPDYDSFAWQVLDTLAGAASAEVLDGRYAVTLTMGMDPVTA